MKNKITKFIINFKKGFPSDIVEDLFTESNCYHFAVILTNIFEGDILYDVDNNHFISKIDGNYYDITGEVEKPFNSYFWEEMESEDPIEYDLVYESCVILK